MPERKERFSRSTEALHGERHLKACGAIARISREGRVRAFDLHPIAGTRLREIIPDRVMLRAAIVPESDRVLLPAETYRPQCLFAVIVKEGENRCAFGRGQFVDMR